MCWDASSPSTLVDDQAEVTATAEKRIARARGAPEHERLKFVITDVASGLFVLDLVNPLCGTYA